MLVTGTIAGSLLAVDTALDLDLTSVLYPVWQAAVAVRLALALQPYKPIPVATGVSYFAWGCFRDFVSSPSRPTVGASRPTSPAD